MNHLQHIESVALSDCAVLHTKESTYQGSWKRAGGRSAWFMARRNLDRMMTMMQPPKMSEFFNLQNVDDTIKAIVEKKPLPGTIEATADILWFLRNAFKSEDIFAMIKTAPSGEDGTLLACMRDARRYFMLVEAEMIAEGIVEPEAKTYEQESSLTIHEWDGQETMEFIITINGRPVENVTSCIVHSEGGVRRVDINVEAQSPASMDPGPAVGDLKATASGGYAAEQAARHQTAWHDKIGALLRRGDMCTWQSENNSIIEVEFVGVIDDQPLVKVNAEGDTVVTEWKRLRRDSNQPARGEQQNHAKSNPLWPWHATRDEYEAIHKRVGMVADMFYSRRAAGVFQLEPVVGSHTCPGELGNYYTMVTTTDGPTKWVLKADKIAAELRMNYPELQREMNTKEHEESPMDFRFMYEYTEGDQKWKLRPQFEAWGRDVG